MRTYGNGRGTVSITSSLEYGARAPVSIIMVVNVKVLIYDSRCLTLVVTAPYVRPITRITRLEPAGDDEPLDVLAVSAVCP
jgi:hypothetical protein